MSKSAFLFPGQGAQYVGMAKGLHDELSSVRELFDESESILGYDLRKLCFEGPREQLDATDHSQPAILVASLAALQKAGHERPSLAAEVTACGGLSLGEYTALVFAEALDWRDALRIVRVRGEAMQQAAEQVPSGMVSVLGLEPSAVQTLCDQARVPGEVLQPANFLCPGNIVVSGAEKSVAQLQAMASDASAKVMPLAVAGAFHTPIMAPAQERLRAALEETEIRKPAHPRSCPTSTPHRKTIPKTIRELLLQQLVRPVRWEDSVRTLQQAGCEQYYEIGPGRVLKGLMKRIDRGLSCENVTA